MVEKKENNNVVKNGIIGFFDILGYGSLLENNEPEEIYNEIYPILENIQEYFKSELKIVKINRNRVIDKKPEYKELIDGVDWLIFSDTILITFDTPQDNPENMRDIWSIFFTACGILQKKCFKKVYL